MQTPFAELGALKVDDLYAQAVRVFAFKAARGMLPSGMASMIDKVSHGYNTRGARSNFFIDRTDGRSLKSIVPNIWNSTPGELKGLTNIASFKEKSKGGLLAPYSSIVLSGVAALVQRLHRVPLALFRCVHASL